MLLLRNIRYAIRRCNVVPVRLLLLIQLSSVSIAQESKLSVTVEMDTTKMLIGEQVRAVLRIQQFAAIDVDRPVFMDTLGAFEVIRIGPVDTVHSDIANFIQTTQEIILTTFDSGFYVIPPVSAQFKQDTTDIVSKSEAILIAVYTVPVDTTAAIRDIKANINMPLGWRDFLPYILVILTLLILFLVGRYIYNRYFVKKEKAEIVKVVRPAHEIAFEALELLRTEQLWQKGEIKLFHTKLTDIVRDYLKNRYGINAPEMTTDELLQSPSAQILDAGIVDDLKHVLKLADLVKFAKSKPGAVENENCFQRAQTIVNRTKIILQETIEVKTEEEAT